MIMPVSISDLNTQFKDDNITGFSRNRRRIKLEQARASNNDSVDCAFRRVRGRSRGTRIRVVSRGPDFAAKGDGLRDGSDFRCRRNRVISIGSSRPCSFGRSRSRVRSRGGCCFETFTNGESGFLEVGE